MQPHDILEVFKAYTVLGNQGFAVEEGVFFTRLDGDTQSVVRTSTGYKIEDLDHQQPELYPLLAYLMASGQIPVNMEFTNLFSGFVWAPFRKMAEEDPQEAVDEAVDTAAFDHERLGIEIRIGAQETFEAFEALDLHYSLS